MLSTEDKQIKFPAPFLKNGTVLFVTRPEEAEHYYKEPFFRYLDIDFSKVSYTLAYLPEIAGKLDGDMLQYLFPGREEGAFADEMYHRLQALTGIEDLNGFFYKYDGVAYYRAIPEWSSGQTENAISSFIEHLRSIQKPESNIRFSKIDSSILNESYLPSIDSAAFDEICFSVTNKEKEEPIELDPRAKAISEAWERIERQFGVTIKDVEFLIGYKVKLSHLHITTSGKIILSDWEGAPEVKMNDLTKAVYFFFLKHPEGARLKELHSHEKEILQYYTSITGRDDIHQIRNSVEALLDPFGNNLNVCLSRIKKAFKDIVGERIAKFYYVDGRYGEIRKIALDRDFVIWEH